MNAGETPLRSGCTIHD